MLVGIALLLVNADPMFFLISFAGGGLLAYYWTIYLTHAVTFTRIRATADLLLSVLYMVISLRITPNFENALLFAALNTTGTIGRDLKKIVWDLSLGKYESADEALAFIAYLGVEYVTTGGPASPTYTPEGRVVQARPNDPAPPWKDADLAAMKARVEGAGLKIGNLMLHDFRRAILGRPGADEDIALVQESIRAAGRAGIPIVEYNWYALRAMGGYYEEPGRSNDTFGYLQWGLSVGTDLTFIPEEAGTWNFSVTGNGYYLGQSLKRANHDDQLQPQVIGSLNVSY